MKKLSMTAPTAVRQPYIKVLAENEDARIVYIALILDMSGSMQHLQKTVFEAAQRLLAALIDKTNEDFEYRVQVIVFNDSVRPIVTDYLPPEQVSELFTERDYVCDGGTDLTGVVQYMDEHMFTRSAPLAQHLHRSDPKAVSVIITDYVGTDDENSRSKALNVLSTNRLFTKASNCICILCGSAAGPEDVLPLCGSRDNVVKLDPKLDFASILAPVLIGSTLVLGDGTHLRTGDEQDQTPAEVAEKQSERAASGQQGADTLTKEELAQAMADMFKDVNLTV